MRPCGRRSGSATRLTRCDRKLPVLPSLAVLLTIEAAWQEQALRLQWLAADLLISGRPVVDASVRPAE